MQKLWSVEVSSQIFVYAETEDVARELALDMLDSIHDNDDKRDDEGPCHTKTGEVREVPVDDE